MESLTATLNFLTDAGHLLATTAPESSAYLMSQRNGLMLENGMAQSDIQKQHVCDRCGHIMVMGKQSSLNFKPVKIGREKQNVKKRPEPRKSGPTKTITCGLCESQTLIKLPAPAPISRRKIKPQNFTKPAAPGWTATVGTPSLLGTSQDPKTKSNANSKKRAKSRKSGLQALLEQSKSSRPGLGLSLADFMSK